MTPWKHQSGRSFPSSDARGDAPPVRQAPAPLRDAFMPTRPQKGGTGFIGRQAELRRMQELLQDEAAHVVLCAERGMGKTSLVNKLTSVLRAAGYCVGRHCCDAGSSYRSIMLGLVRDLPSSFVLLPLSDHPNPQGAEHALPSDGFGPGDIANMPSRLGSEHTVLVIDEFDRVQDRAARDRLIDTIKQVSDRGANLSFVIVGVSDDLEALIGNYPFAGRSIVGLRLQPLPDNDICQIVDHAAAASGYAFPGVIRDHVAFLASGSPYLAHLLGLRTCLAARARGAWQVIGDDLGRAVNQVLTEVHPELLSRLPKHIVDAGAAGSTRDPDGQPARQLAH